MAPDTIHYTMERMVGATSSLPDRYTQLAVIAFGKSIGREDTAREVIREARHRWMAWQFRTQRKWQMKTHRPSRANHHDSIEIREHYVRCAR